MESLTKLLFDFDKLPAKLMFIICLLSGAILFVPTQHLAKLNLESFEANYGQWVGISFLTSFSFLTVSLITMIRKKIGNRKYLKNVEKEIRNNLGRLDPIEKSILREFYLVGFTVNLPMDNAQVVGLQDKHIIRLAQSNLGGSYFVSGGFEMPFMLTEYARSIIDANLHLIGLPMLNGGHITNEQKDMLVQSRPPWTRNRYY